MVFPHSPQKKYKGLLRSTPPNLSGCCFLTCLLCSKAFLNFSVQWYVFLLLCAFNQLVFFISPTQGFLLHFLVSICWIQNTEEIKITIVANFRTTMIRCLIHLHPWWTGWTISSMSRRREWWSSAPSCSRAATPGSPRCSAGSWLFHSGSWEKSWRGKT